MAADLSGRENAGRWMVASIATGLATGGFPYPFRDVRLSPNEPREEEPIYMEMIFVGPHERPQVKEEVKFTVIVQLVPTVFKTTNLYWLEQLQGWAQRLLKPCFTINAVPFKYEEAGQTITLGKSGSGLSVGEARLIGSKVVDNLGPDKILHRSTVTAMYEWETTWSILQANMG